VLFVAQSALFDLDIKLRISYFLFMRFLLVSFLFKTKRLLKRLKLYETLQKMIPPLLWLLMAAASGGVVQAQTRAQDCAIANTIWRKMGRTSWIPSSCCSSTYGITCSSTRITEM
jgi:hypothetical protein